METEKTLSASAEAVITVLKEHPGEALTFAEIANFAGISPRLTGVLSSVKRVLGEHLVIGSKEVMGESKHAVSRYKYTAPETPFTPSAKSEPSANSKLLADWFVKNEGKAATLAEISEELGQPVASGYLAGARAILGKENIVKDGEEIAYRPVKRTINTYTYND